MTVLAPTDILYKLSAPNANAGNSLAGYPGTSWGGWLSTSVLNSTVPLDNLFTDITGPQNAAGQVDYACLFIQNNTASGMSMTNTVVWIPSSLFSGSGSTVAIAGDPTGVTAINSNVPQALTINSATIPPAGITTWNAPVSTTPNAPNYPGGVVLGIIAPGQCAAIWVQRTATNSNSPSLTNLTIMLMCS